MQLFSILKGCVAAYTAGVLIVWGTSLWSYWQGTNQVLDQWGSLLVIVVFGAFFALPITIFVIICWAFLSRKNSTVDCYLALMVGAGLNGLLFWGLNGTLYGLIVGIPLGLVFGAVFWLVAFGSCRHIVMRRG